MDSAFRKITENEAKELKTHLVFASYYYNDILNGERLISSILEGMKKYKIEKVMVTKIDMWREKLITKEAMDKYCKGEEDWGKYSVNDDLESLFGDLRLGKEPNEWVNTYFLPKLTEEEMELVKRKDTTYFETFDYKKNPDVEEVEMMLSESDSKFIDGWGRRHTFTIENSSEQNIFNRCNLQ